MPSQDWEKLSVVMHRSALPLLDMALAAIARENTLPENPALARGVAIEWMAADFLAGRHGYTAVPVLPPGNWL